MADSEDNIERTVAATELVETIERSAASILVKIV
jgi:hypothetical protein